MRLEVGAPDALKGRGHEGAESALEGLCAFWLEHISAGAVLKVGFRVEVPGVRIRAASHLLPRAD